MATLLLSFFVFERNFYTVTFLSQPTPSIDYELRERRNQFDIHVYYTEANKQRAFQFRKSLKENFSWLVFHQPLERALGPHPTPSWEADFFQSNLFYFLKPKIKTFIFLGNVF